MGIEKFQKDLKDGMTLEDALIKHNLTFREAVELCPRPMACQKITRKPKTRRNVYQKVDTYISLRNDSYMVRRQQNGKSCWGGAYNSLEDAQKVRDYLNENGWNIVKVNEACKKFGIERRKR